MPYRVGPLRPPVSPQRPRRLGAVLLAFSVGAGVAAYHLIPRTPARRATPVYCRDVIVASRDGGVTNLLCGPVRATLSPSGEPAVGVERLDAPIVSAVEVASGWVFVSETGLVARSDTFTGRLQLLGTVGCELTQSRESIGRLAGIDSDGVLWTTDGRRPVAAVTFAERVYSVAFADAMRGAVALQHGALMVTSDGGANWARADLGPDLATSVEAGHDGRLVAQTTAGPRLITAGGLRPDAIPIVYSRLVFDATWEQVARVEHAGERATEVLLPPERAMRCSSQPPTPPVEQVEPLASPPAPADTTPAPEPQPFTALLCHVPRPHRGRPRPPRSAPPETQFEPIDQATSGSAEIVGWRTPDQELRFAARWSGVDAAGRFAGSASPLIEGHNGTTDPYDLDWHRADGVAAVEGMSRAGMVFSSGGIDNALYWAAPGRPVVSLGRTRGGFDRRLAAPQPDGGIALLYWTERGVDRSVGVGLEISAAGAITHSRAFIVDPRYGGMPLGLARWNGSLGIVRHGAEGEAPPLFFPLDGSPAVPFPGVTSDPAICAGPPRAGAIIHWTDATPWRLEPPTEEDVTGENGGLDHALFAEHEIADGRECLRSFVLLHDASLSENGNGPALASAQMRLGARGNFEGTLNDLGRIRVTCRLGTVVSPTVVDRYYHPPCE